MDTAQPAEHLEIGKISPVFPKSIDSTMVATFATCPQRFFLEYCLRIAPVGTSPHLHAGGCFASAIENVRRGVWQYGMELEEAIYHAAAPFIKQWGSYVPPRSGKGEQPISGEGKDMVNVWGAVLAYFDEWNPKTDVLQPLRWDDKPALEFTFALPMGVNHPVTGDPLLYSGRCDMVGEYKGFIAPVDEKTTERMGPTWANQWSMRGQFLGYCHAVREHGYPSCNHAVARGVGILKTEYKFAEAFTPYPERLVDLWWHETHQKAKRMIAMWEQMELGIATVLASGDEPAHVWHDFWDYDFADGCTSYGGCNYRSLCRNGNQWDWYADYGRRMWDPLKKNPTEGSTDRALPKDEVNLADVDPELLKQLGVEV